MTDKQLEQDRHAFLKALVEDKYDRSTHQVFADWLYEQGEDTLLIIMLVGQKRNKTQKTSLLTLLSVAVQTMLL